MRFPRQNLEWVAIPFSRASSQPGDRNCILFGRWILFHWATWEAHCPKSKRLLKEGICSGDLHLRETWRTASFSKLLEPRGSTRLWMHKLGLSLGRPNCIWNCSHKEGKKHYRPERGLMCWDILLSSLKPRTLQPWAPNLLRLQEHGTSEEKQG